MKKLQKVTSIPIIAAIMLLQGIDMPTDVPREEAEKIIQTLQDLDDSMDRVANIENK